MQEPNCKDTLTLTKNAELKTKNPIKLAKDVIEGNDGTKTKDEIAAAAVAAEEKKKADEAAAKKKAEEEAAKKKADEEAAKNKDGKRRLEDKKLLTSDGKTTTTKPLTSGTADDDRKITTNPSKRHSPSLKIKRKQ